ncbi:MAG: ArsR family transcriptional regulator [Gammaproteobacteria bacterium]
MIKYESQLDAVFVALAHPDLKVLERAQLISRSKTAQWRPCQLEAAPLKTASLWIEQQRKVWEFRLDRLEKHLHSVQKQRGSSDGRG